MEKFEPMSLRELERLEQDLKETSEKWKIFGVGDEYETTGYLAIGDFVKLTEELMDDDGMTWNDLEFLAEARKNIGRLLATIKDLRENAIDHAHTG